MPLTALWKSAPNAVAEFKIDQVVSTAGDGNIKDNSVCSSEFRAFLKEIQSDKIASYVDQCLSNSFNNSGYVLQDLINELGRRLDYDVENGRYQGVKNDVGFDGFWASPEGHFLIVEIKTTDAYRISLDDILEYRRKQLERNPQITSSSVLIVVGRQDTGELEAQIRGSRHAWDVRLISAEALFKLVELKENAEGPSTGLKIRSLLVPKEYTRLDSMIDVMFTTAKDVEDAITFSAPPADVPSDTAVLVVNESGQPKNSWDFTDPKLLEKKRTAIIKAFEGTKSTKLMRKSRALYWDPTHKIRVACTLSKRYMRKGGSPYWYAYHPQWRDFLLEGPDGFFILGCMDLDFAFAVPANSIASILSRLNTTIKDDGDAYWHIHLSEVRPGSFEIVLPKQDGHFSLDKYKFGLD